MNKNHVTSKFIVRGTVLLLFLMFGISGYSQDDNVKHSEYKTIFGEKATYGGYGGVRLGYTTVGDYDALSVGVQGGWIVGHGLAIGLAARGFFSESSQITIADENSYSIGGAYGGFLVEPIFFGKFPIHFSVPIIIGGGGISYSTNYNNDYNNDGFTIDIGNSNSNNWDPFFLVEPGLDVEVNVARFLRVAAGVSYRLTTDVSVNNNLNPVVETNDLNTLTYSLTFKFGKF